MLRCKSSNKLTRGKNQRVPENLDFQKMDGLWNRVEHWTTYPILLSICEPYWNCHGVVQAMTFEAYVPRV